MITLPQLKDLELLGLCFEPSRRRARRERLWSFRSYATAATPPLNTAMSISSYSINGSSWTVLENVLNSEYSGRAWKIIERRRKGVLNVEKFAARVDNGKLKVTMEAGAALFTVFNNFAIAKAKIYWKEAWDDSGGTAASTIVSYGPIGNFDAPSLPGDDADQEFSFEQAVETLEFTAGN